MEYLESFVQGDDAFKDRLARDPEVWTKVANGANRARTSAKKKQQAVDRCRAGEAQKVFTTTLATSSTRERVPGSRFVALP
jgi:hypothetical protein